MPESTFTIRVDDQLKDAFAEAAHTNDRTGAQLIRNFMREYVQASREKAEYEEWFKAKVETGLLELAAGRVISHGEVKARSLARRERLLAGIRKHT